MKRLFLLALILILCFSSFAQKNSSLYWFGYLQSAYKYSIQEDVDNSGQFDVLLSCLGLVADINEYSQVFIFVYGNYPAISAVGDSNEVSARDYIGVLDAQIRFKPIKNLQLTAGQFITPFAKEHFKSSSKIDFIGRGLVVANSPSYRDIGTNLKYSNSFATIYGGVTNGSGMNTFDSNKYKNFSAWAELKPFVGLSVMGGTSIGKDNNAVDSLAENQNYYSGGFLYSIGNLDLAAEASVKNYLDANTKALYAYGCYDIPIKSDLLHWITPAFRYDFLDPPRSDDRLDRYTFGLSLSFDENKWLSMFRINYEMIEAEYDNSPDNLVVEFQMRFD